jgi:hypothetical protein
MSELTQVAGQFLGVCDSVHKLKKFIQNGSMETALKAIGDVNLKAAKDELRSIEKSRNARETVNRAATQLRTAYVAFYERQRRDKISSGNASAIFSAQQKMYVTAMALVSCYVYLEEWEYALDILSDPEKEDDYIPSHVTFVNFITTMANPKTYVDLVSKNDVEDLKKMEEKFYEFGKNIRTLIPGRSGEYQHDDDQLIDEIKASITTSEMLANKLYKGWPFRRLDEATYNMLAPQAQKEIARMEKFLEEYKKLSKLKRDDSLFMELAQSMTHLMNAVSTRKP